MKNKTILVGEQIIEYRVRRHRRSRHLRLTVNCDASVLVSMPWYARLYDAERFVRLKAEWIARRVHYFKTHTNQWYGAGKTDHFKQHQADAEKIIARKLVEVNRLYGFDYGAVRVRNQKTRWGSCSKNGNLSFNYRLMFLDDALVEYVVAHELCHLRELNHSARFWRLVEMAIPDYKMRRRELMKKRF